MFSFKGGRPGALPGGAENAHTTMEKWVLLVLSVILSVAAVTPRMCVVVLRVKSYLPASERSFLRHHKKLPYLVFFHCFFHPGAVA